MNVNADTKRRSEEGFTLIELMIVVAIVGILSAIAYPNYTQYVIRSARADAKASALQAVQCLERTFTLNNVYVAATCANGFNTAKHTVTTVVGGAGRTFLVTAAPTSPYSDPTCGSVSIDQLGARTSTIGTVDECWSR